MSMQLTFEPPRLTGLAILAVAAATSLSVGACSSSHDEKSPSSSSSSSPGAAKSKNKDVVKGQVASVSGNAVQVSESSGTATIDLSPSAQVTDYITAQLTDVAAGICVRVIAKPAPAAGSPATADLVRLSPPAGDGKCPQEKHAATSPNKHIAAGGTVASVEGNNIKVADIDADGKPAQTEVTVTDKTQYSKGVPANSQAVAQGKCISARGTKDGGGTLQASFVDLFAADDKGQCPTSPAK
jgi:hypothetical protein